MASAFVSDPPGAVAVKDTLSVPLALAFELTTHSYLPSEAFQVGVVMLVLVSPEVFVVRV